MIRRTFLAFLGGLSIAVARRSTARQLEPIPDKLVVLTFDDFAAAESQARNGKTAVLQFQGVPEGEHPWVDTPRARFEEYMHQLCAHGYRAIALRDLSRYVDPTRTRADPWAVIRRRGGTPPC